MPPTEPPTRQVTLVLCTPEGELLGVLPPYDVARPWWQEVSGVVAAARAVYGAEVTVLRLLATRDPLGTGGPVTYLAETSGPVDEVRPWDGPDPLAPHPLRLPYAQPGGPDADLAWADEVLAARGSERAGDAVQQRTWNLSSVWRIPTTEGDAWLKVVPPFFGHEGAMLERIGAAHPDLVPPLLGAADGRVLLRHVAGGDNYGAGMPVLLAMVRALVEVQAEWVERVDELLALGAPDWRAGALETAVRDVVDRTADQLDRDTLLALRLLVDGLPARLAAVAGCGVPDTLVHGDYHPGNTVGAGPRPVILDWGDAGAGNAMLDRAALTARLTPVDRTVVLAEWAKAWGDRVPGSDPTRAADLLAPVAALRQAVVYRAFLDGIEETEQVYHASDPADRLLRAAALAVSG